VQQDDVIRLILTSCDHITVVGCSRDPDKTAQAIPARMQRLGYRITPINPHASEILGERAYPRLADAPKPVDMVQVFRPSRDAADVVAEAVAVGASAVWLQQGIRSETARTLCREAGILYVEDQCMAVDYVRLNIAALRAAS
jgi:predicted CoA-binding protein